MQQYLLLFIFVLAITIIVLFFLLLLQINHQKKLQTEFMHIILKAAHDIGSPLASLEVIAQSASVALPADSRVMIGKAAMRVREAREALLEQTKQYKSVQ